MIYLFIFYILKSAYYFIVSIDSINKMNQKCQWTEEEDNILRYIFETCKMKRWSQIAKKMQDQQGLKRRNAKQCKQRIMTHIDPNYFKEQWTEQQDQEFMKLHNKLGNKWAIIGSILGNKTDNYVKNHFYLKLRKALKKINHIISLSKNGQFKEIKANTLYRIVQVAQQNFKLPINYDKQFSALAIQLKNLLFNFASQGEMDNQNQNQNQIIMIKKGQELIYKMNDFVNTYKRRNKKQNKKQEGDQGLLKPMRYHGAFQAKQNGENEESSGSGDVYLSSITSNLSSLSDEQLSKQNKQSNLSKIRRNSMEETSTLLSINKRMITRATSQGNLQSFSKQQPKIQQIQRMDVQLNKTQDEGKKDQLKIQKMLGDLDIMQMGEDIEMNPLFMKKNESKYSYNSQRNIQEQQFYFFEESQMNVRIFPDYLLMNKRDSQHQQSLF